MRLIPRPIASSIASSIARPSLWLAAVAIIAFPLSGWCQQQTETQPATTTAQAAADAPAPSAAKQDSLAEAARKAREQKKESKPAKVFTNDNLPTSGGISTVGAAAEPSASSNTGDASTPDTRGTKSGSGDQKTWRDRFATLHHKLDQDTMDLDVMQRELGVLNVQYYNDPVKAMQQGLTRDDINKKTADIDAKKQAIEADQKAIDDAEEDLRKSGGDPGVVPLGDYSLMEPVLLVEDKNELRAMLRKALERSGYKVDEAPDGNVAIEKLRSRTYQMVLSDLKLPGHSGIDVLREAKKAEPTLPVILVTAYGSVDEAVTAMKEGAYDFLQKPVDLDHLGLVLERAARQQELLRENLLLREEYAARYGFPRIVGEHVGMKEASQMTQRVAATDSTVLLLGESGTGKELFARAIHHLSPRAAQPFVALNCAAIPDGLVENELFGHERGAYTGAGSRKIGKLELAHRGTIFLDEIGDLPLAAQSKLLRVLEERRFERVGGTQEIEVNVRIVTATNKDLRAAVEDKSFREDLYFRISAVPITIPRLRDRGDDILLLAEHFLERFRGEFHKPALALTAEARRRLCGYTWPGNVRELQNTIERAAILANGPEIGEQELQLPAARPDREELPDGMLEEKFLWEGPLDEVSQRAITHVERFKIHNALRESKWNKTRAAESLGVSYKTLLTKIRALGLEN